jgi:hypothetical protein
LCKFIFTNGKTGYFEVNQDCYFPKKGSGYYQGPNGDEYDGEFNGDWFTGTITNENGYHFKGTYSIYANIKKDSVSIEYPNNKKFEGTLSDEEYCVTGSEYLIKKNRNKYEGKFTNRVFFEGTIVYENGNIFTGTSKNSDEVM